MIGIRKGSIVETNEKWKEHVNKTNNFPEQFRTDLKDYYKGKVQRIEGDMVYFIESNSKEELSFNKDWMQRV